MARTYKRKTVTKYKIEDLKKAVKEVVKGTLTLGKAALKYNVPKTTIFDQLNKTTVIEPKAGIKTLFSVEQERELEEYILKCCRLFYGLTVDKIRKIAFQFAEVNKLRHKFNKNTCTAGKDWYYNFIKRHPNISLRKPEGTSLNRINAFNESEVQIFIDNLISLKDKYKFDAESIYNVDETGIFTVQKNLKILASKRQKQVGKCISVERGIMTTVVCAFSASGKYVPPFFIFKRKRMHDQLMKGSNNNMIAGISDSGWINENLFCDWLHHFIYFTKASKETPVLLILNNYESHISLESFMICRDNGINLITLPPHTSHKLQPLDLTFFGPLKSAYNIERERYMAEHPGRRITQYEVVELFTKAFNRVSNIEKAQNGFKAAGIYPFDSYKFEEFFSTSTEETTPNTSDNLTNPSNTVAFSPVGSHLHT